MGRSSIRRQGFVPDLTGINFERKDGAGNVTPFLWGVSTASHQVEGGIEGSDWYHFVHSEKIKHRVERVGDLGGTRLRLEPPGEAVHHWDLDVFAEDLDRVKLLGMNAYRLSLEWSRIQPTRPAWAECYVRLRREAEDALGRAAVLRGLAEKVEQGSSDAERVMQFNAEASAEEERAAQAQQAAAAYRGSSHSTRLNSTLRPSSTMDRC